MRSPTTFVLRCLPSLILLGISGVSLVSCSDDKGTPSSTSGGALASGGATSGGATSGGATSGGAPATTGGVAGAATTGGVPATTGGVPATTGGVPATTGGIGGAATTGGVGGLKSTGGAGGVTSTGGAGGVTSTGGAGGVSNAGGSGGASGFTLASNNHMEGAKFADKYTCALKGFDGSVMPELHWTAGPANTKSYAITFIDTTLTKADPPNNLGYHWVIYDIPPTTTSLPEELSATQVTALGAKQNRAFLGPCPGGKADSYEFTIYALASEKSTFTGSGTGIVKDAETKLEANNLAKAKLSGTSSAKQP